MEHTDKILNALKSNSSVVDTLKDEVDLCVYVLHLAMSQYGWTCIGTSETKTTAPAAAAATPGANKAVLPTGWNASSDVYTLTYQFDQDPAVTAVLKCLRIGQTLLVNAMLLHTQNKIYTLDIEIPQLIKQPNYKLLTDIKDAFTHLDQLLAMFEMSILVNITPKKKSSLQEDLVIEKDRSYNVEHSKNITQPPQFHNPPLMVGGGGGGRGGHGGGLGGGFGGGFGTGDHDLDPIGMPHLPNMVGGAYRPQFPGAGNQIGPNHPGFGRVHFPYGGNDNSQGLPFGERLPPGAVPPGARFDPFGPPTGGRPSGGSHRSFGDEMPPPGFNDYYS
ncbi:hypothetical protein SAMD00019534_006810, partial [Acytostelium subglobosum LB1]|uniref:hypothetical protein n=1 Tax=Acytostelium subglobosum LB1 TaxID=1410327 RepID=UPI000644ECDA